MFWRSFSFCLKNSLKYFLQCKLIPSEFSQLVFIYRKIEQSSHITASIQFLTFNIFH